MKALIVADLSACDSGAGERSDDSCEATECERFRLSIEAVDLDDKGVANGECSAIFSLVPLGILTCILFIDLTGSSLPKLGTLSSTKSGRLLGDSSTNAGRLDTSSIAASVKGGDGGDS